MTYLLLKFRETVLTDNELPSYQIVLTLCSAEENFITVLYVKLQNDLITDIGFWNEQNFRRFEFLYISILSYDISEDIEVIKCLSDIVCGVCE